MIFDLVNLKKKISLSLICKFFQFNKEFQIILGHFHQDLQFSAGLIIQSVKNLLHQIFYA